MLFHTIMFGSKVFWRNDVTGELDEGHRVAC